MTALAARPRLEPWGVGHVVMVGAGNALAGALLALAWYGAARSVRVNPQMGWVNLGIAAVGAAAAVNTTFLLGGRRALARRRDDCLQARHHRRRNAGHPVERAAPATDHFVAGAAMGRYHRPACILVQGKRTESLTRAAHEAARRTGCGVCRP